MSVCEKRRRVLCLKFVSNFVFRVLMTLTTKKEDDSALEFFNVMCVMREEIVEEQL